MNQFQRRLRCMVVLCLLSSPVLAIEVDAGLLVEQLNRRYASTPEACPGGKQQPECSGVLAGEMPDSKSIPFWDQDVFAYLRADQPGNRPSGRGGFILMNASKARLQKKEYSLADDQVGLMREVRVVYRDSGKLDERAVEAFYYASDSALDLLRAQRGQWTWFQQTGNWLPVFRYRPGNDRGVFEFDLNEQLYHGPDVAAAVMKRYFDRAARCLGDKPALDCNGVLFRTTTNGNFDT